MIPQLILKQELKQIIIRGGSVVVNILPFTCVPAISNNQTMFTMLNAQGQPIIFSQIICLFIMGAGQNPIGTVPDYTVSENSITFSEGVPIGTVVYGAGQI